MVLGTRRFRVESRVDWGRDLGGGEQTRSRLFKSSAQWPARIGIDVSSEVPRRSPRAGLKRLVA